MEWEADAPYCTFQIPYQGGSLTGRFFLNEAALSKFPLSWVREFVRRLPELDRRGRTFLAAQAGLGHCLLKNRTRILEARRIAKWDGFLL